jgi:hypothetical protein
LMRMKDWWGREALSSRVAANARRRVSAGLNSMTSSMPELLVNLSVQQRANEGIRVGRCCVFSLGAYGEGCI